MTLPLPRFIQPAAVIVGQTIRVTTKTGDVERTATAKVGRIVHGQSGSTFISVNGNEFGWFRYGSPIRVTLLKESAREPEPTLFDL